MVAHKWKDGKGFGDARWLGKGEQTEHTSGWFTAAEAARQYQNCEHRRIISVSRAEVGEERNVRVLL